MSTPRGAGFTFLPWVQRGLARAIGVADEPDAALAARVTLSVGLRVDGVGDVPASIRLYGPGDVTGIERGQITRTEPRPGSTSFEAGYMPAVEFVRADLPWLFTPAAPKGERLRPWLVLVVVRRRDGVRLDRHANGPLPVLEITAPARGAEELPELAQSWAWAHAQISGVPVGQTPAQILDAESGVACSRLVCPRRLEPSTGYLACVVPAFAVGVKAGLGEPVEAADEEALAPAWTPNADPIRLPVYYSWEFATGPAGSFETLVRRLQPRPARPCIHQTSRVGHQRSGKRAANLRAGHRRLGDRDAERASRSRSRRVAAVARRDASPVSEGAPRPADDGGGGHDHRAGLRSGAVRERDAAVANPVSPRGSES